MVKEVKKYGGLNQEKIKSSVINKKDSADAVNRYICDIEKFIFR